jgi:flagellar basal-body rod protein FlgB
MWNSLIGGNNVLALQQTLEFTERRHNLLAGNVANMDTPDYQTRDLSIDNFQRSLDEALSSVQQAKDNPGLPVDPIAEKLQSVASVSSSGDMSKVRDSMKQILYHDGSDDSLEQQVTEIAKNLSMHNTATSILRSQFRTMQMAISESVNV